MAVTSGRPGTRRSWFVDPRSPERRMSVATHPEAGVAVVSLWQGPTCSATFRLPVAEAARLIGALAEGMAASLPDSVPEGRDTGSWPRRLAAWSRRTLRRPPRRPPDGLRLVR